MTKLNTPVKPANVERESAISSSLDAPFAPGTAPLSANLYEADTLKERNSVQLFIRHVPEIARCIITAQITWR